MDIKINIEKKIKFNGVEYHSLEEMPPYVREEFEKLMSGDPETMARHIRPPSGEKIKFNGVEYNSVEAIPQDIRQVYEKAISSLEEAARSMGGKKTLSFSAGTGGSLEPAKQGSSGLAKAMIIAAIITGVFLVVYFLMSGR